MQRSLCWCVNTCSTLGLLRKSGVILSFMYMEQEKILLVGEQDRYILGVLIQNQNGQENVRKEPYDHLCPKLPVSFKTKGNIYVVRTVNTELRTALLSHSCYYLYDMVNQIELLCMAPKCPLNLYACSQCHGACTWLKWWLTQVSMNLLSLLCWFRWLHSCGSPSAPAPVRSYQQHCKAGRSTGQRPVPAFPAAPSPSHCSRLLSCSFAEHHHAVCCCSEGWQHRQFTRCKALALNVEGGSHEVEWRPKQV